MANRGHVFTCEICDQKESTEEKLKLHYEQTHRNGQACPLCDLAGVSYQEMEHHINTAHKELDNENGNPELSPLQEEPEEKAFLEDEMHEEEYSSIWRLDESAKEGLTNGVDQSPKERKEAPKFPDQPPKPSNATALVNHAQQQQPPPPPHQQPRTSLSSNNVSPMSTSTEMSGFSTCSSSTPPPFHRTYSSSPYGGAIQKKFRVNSVGNSPVRSRAHMTLDIARDRSLPAQSPQARQLACPMCSYCDSDSKSLQEHVNRKHLDLISPATTTITPEAAIASGSGSSFPCFLCEASFPTSNQLERHVNIDHSDILSPEEENAGAKKNPANMTQGNDVEVGQCPICFQTGFRNHNLLAEHSESHFTSTPTSTQEEERRRREKRRYQEQKEFEALRAQYGMDDQGNYKQQTISKLEKEARKGNISVADYYERQIELHQNERLGADDGRSVTANAIAAILNLSSNSPGLARTFITSAVDHYGSTSGDKGWGCGYRNLQMLLSSLLKETSFRSALSASLPRGGRVPSISRLQQMIETAWTRGFDVQGRDQLEGKLHNTRKWIGATEIVALLRSLRVKAQVVDFHKPTANDGSHPKMVEWVLEYFRSHSSASFTPPLYFQHQGHSRTIVGAEVLKNGHVRLLLFDPSYHHMGDVLQSGGKSQQVMKSIRKPLATLRSKQYQIVSVSGIYNSQREAEAHKAIVGKRIP